MPSSDLIMELAYGGLLLAFGGMVAVAARWLLGINRRLLMENRSLLGKTEIIGGPLARHRWISPIITAVILAPGLGFTVAKVRKAPVPNPPVLVVEPIRPVVAEPLEARRPAPDPAVMRTYAPADDCRPITLGQGRQIAREAGVRANVSPGLLLAIIFRESRFSPCAVSASGAKGLMQLKPATAKQFGVRDPFDPVDNVAGGARYLRWLLDRYQDDTGAALGAYLQGPGFVDRNRGLPPESKTQDYIDGIQELAEVLAD